MTLRLCLTRHASTDWSDAGRLNGWTDVPLNARGRQQAAALRGVLSGADFAEVWTSDFRRARETARLAVGDAVPDRRLRELDFGAIEGMRWEELRGPQQRALAAFQGFRAPGGESVADLKSRVLRFVQELEDGAHLLFTHGGVIRLFLSETGANGSIAPGEFIVLDLGRRRLGPRTSPGSGPRPSPR